MDAIEEAAGRIFRVFLAEHWARFYFAVEQEGVVYLDVPEDALAAARRQLASAPWTSLKPVVSMSINLLSLTAMWSAPELGTPTGHSSSRRSSRRCRVRSLRSSVVDGCHA